MGPVTDLLAPEFWFSYVHTGEHFDRDSWVRLNVEYPGFQNLVLEDCVGSGDRAAGRAHVTGLSDGRLEHFGVATFVRVRDGLIVEMTEVWTDITSTTPGDRRPQLKPDTCRCIDCRRRTADPVGSRLRDGMGQSVDCRPAHG